MTETNKKPWALRLREWRNPRLLRPIALSVGIVVLVWFAGMIVFATNLSKQQGAPGVADGIVALTGGDKRLLEAMKLLAQGKGHRLLISGVNPDVSETAIRGLFDNSDQLFDCCVDLDRSAADTMGNAQQTAQWALKNSYTSLIVVTANYHMPRSLLEFHQAMPEIKLIPYPIESDQIEISDWWYQPNTARVLTSEYNKYLISFVRLKIFSSLS